MSGVAAEAEYKPEAKFERRAFPGVCAVRSSQSRHSKRDTCFPGCRGFALSIDPFLKTFFFEY